VVKVFAEKATEDCGLYCINKDGLIDDLSTKTRCQIVDILKVDKCEKVETDN